VFQEAQSVLYRRTISYSKINRACWVGVQPCFVFNA